MEAPVLKGKKLALISILRAGNGLLDGVLELVPSARVGFIGLYRDEATLQPVQYYSKVPADLDERVTIALDPMLATGNSSVAAVDLLKAAGATDIRFLCLLAAPEGVARMKAAHPDVPHRHRRRRQAPERQGLHRPGPRRRRRPAVRDEVSRRAHSYQKRGCSADQSRALLQSSRVGSSSPHGHSASRPLSASILSNGSSSAGQRRRMARASSPTL